MAFVDREKYRIVPVLYFDTQDITAATINPTIDESINRKLIANYFDN